MPIFFHEAFIRKEEHIIVPFHNVLKGTAIIHVSRIHSPIDNQAQMVDHVAQFAPNDPTLIRQAFLANLLIAAAFPPRMNQLDPVRVHHSDQTGGGQQALSPMLMGIEQPKQPRPIGQRREQGAIVSNEPPIEGPIPNAFECEQDASVTTSLGNNLACECLGAAGSMLSTWQNNSVIKSTVVMLWLLGVVWRQPN